VAPICPSQQGIAIEWVKPETNRKRKSTDRPKFPLKTRNKVMRKFTKALVVALAVLCVGLVSTQAVRADGPRGFGGGGFNRGFGGGGFNRGGFNGGGFNGGGFNRGGFTGGGSNGGSNRGGSVHWNGGGVHWGNNGVYIHSGGFGGPRLNVGFGNGGFGFGIR